MILDENGYSKKQEKFDTDVRQSHQRSKVRFDFEDDSRLDKHLHSGFKPQASKTKKFGNLSSEFGRNQYESHSQLIQETLEPCREFPSFRSNDCQNETISSHPILSTNENKIEKICDESQIRNFKSILKDPLCARLRYNLQQKQYPSNEQQSNVSKLSPTIIPLVSHESAKSIHVIDTDRLESEIDQLLYGSKSLNEISSEEVVVSNQNHSADLDSTIHNLEISLSNERNFKIETVERSNDKHHLITSNKIKPSVAANQAYVKMIEGKYRNGDKSIHVSDALEGCDHSSNDL